MTDKYDFVMGLDEELFNDNDAPVANSEHYGRVPVGDHYYEEITEEIARSLIGDSPIKPNCTYQLVSDMTETSVLRYDHSLSEDDEGFCTSYRLEEYNTSTNSEQDNATDHLRTINDIKQTRFNAFYVILVVFVLLFGVGLAILIFLFRIAG